MSWSPGTLLWPHATSLARVSTVASGLQAHSTNSHQIASASHCHQPLRDTAQLQQPTEPHLAICRGHNTRRSSLIQLSSHCTLAHPAQSDGHWTALTSLCEPSCRDIPWLRAAGQSRTMRVGQHSSWQAIARAQPELQLIHQILIICSKASVPGGHPAIVCLCKGWLV